jgi:uncharacterized protein (DUF952 family)
LISHAVFAIPAIRGIEFGTGFAAARMYGIDHNDVITDKAGTTASNHAGGVVGGITNGNDISFRVAVKPTSSTPKDQFTLNWETGEMETFSVKGRHDLCIALRVPPVLEAVAAIVLADLMMIEQRIPRIWTAPIFHITTKDAWQQALESGQYRASSLETEGFIHASNGHQVDGVLQRFYAGQTGLVKLTIDPSRLSAALKYEGASDVNEKFPHVYGPINTSAVIAVDEI